MWMYLAALIFGLSLLGGIIFLSRKEGKNSARLEALKNEIKERERAQTIINNVRNTSIDSVRDKLKQTK